MRSASLRVAVLSILLLMAVSDGGAQGPPPPTRDPHKTGVPAATPPPPDLGKWWKNSEVVRKLRLGDPQIRKIEDIFLQHRAKLSLLRDELEREEAQLALLLEIQPPPPVPVQAQLEKVIAARNNVERENTSMLLGIRGVMDSGQWRTLQELQAEQEAPPPPPPLPQTSSRETDSRVYKAAEVTQMPRVVSQPPPPYTQEARDNRVNGIILLEVIVFKDGSVGNVKVIRGLGHGLDESAIRTISTQWRFKPGIRNARPVAVRANVEITFRLD